MRNKISWLLSWFSLSILKRSLRSRLRGEGALWVQHLKVKNIRVVNRVDFIIDECRAKDVLHIGFTDHPYTLERIKEGSLLHLQLKKVANSITGIDIEEPAIHQYTAATNDRDVFFTDITKQYPENIIELKPSVILLSEVLEHLTEPYKAVELLHNSFPAGTKVLVTVPNYTSLDSMAASLNNTESVHPHHHWYFSPFTLRKLFDDKRFVLEQLHFGMYYQPQTKINKVLQQFPFTGDCIVAMFSIIKN